MDEVYPGTNGQLPNMPVTYYPLHKMSVERILKPARKFEDKTGYGTGVEVAVFVSNCKKAGASTRLAYIQELMNYIQVSGCTRLSCYVYVSRKL